MSGKGRGWRRVALAAGLAVAALPAGPGHVHAPLSPHDGPADPPGPALALAGVGASVGASAPRPTPHVLRGNVAAPARDRFPVLLLPGWSDDERRLAALGARFLAAGWGSEQVLTLSFEDPVGSNRDHAREIAQAIIALRSRTGAERVDIVAHSMGGLATRYFLHNGGEAHVRRVVFLATPHMGTLTAHFGWGQGAREMEPRSPFLLGLLRASPLPVGVRAITIRTRLDLHVVPQESATLPGVPDLRVCCPTHAGLLDDDQTFALITRFLRDPD